MTDVELEDASHRKATFGYLDCSSSLFQLMPAPVRGLSFDRRRTSRINSTIATVVPMPVTPDTKDWTWVLERSCGECGFDAREYPIETFSATVRANATQWVDVLADVDVHVRPNDDQWSPLEYACHVRDVYRVFESRLTLMLEGENPVFENWDQDETARVGDYAHQDPATVKEELLAAAYTYANRFDTLTSSQWERPGVRSNGSRFTVRSLGLYGLHDPLHHLWDVTTNH